MTKVTKQQAIRELTKLGVTNIKPHGKFQITGVLNGITVVADPRDLLEELKSMRNK